jgi:hypothetical protein
MSPEQLLAIMAKQREFGVDDLPGFEGRRITLRRPTEQQINAEIIVLVPNPADPDTPGARFVVKPEDLHKHAADWSGFTEADLVGAAGSDDVVPFHPALLQAWLADHPDVAHHLGSKLLDVVVDRVNSRAEDAKN